VKVLKFINATSVDSWDRGEGVEIYNGTGTSVVDSGLQYNVNYTYQLWSYTADSGFYQYSLTFASCTGRIPSEPLLSDPIPVDHATGVVLSPVLSIYVEDLQGDSMDVYFRSNASGSWVTLTSYELVGNNTYTCDNTSDMDLFDTWYYWSVNASDVGSGDWTNVTFCFQTIMEPGVWWNTGWSFRKLIVISHEMVEDDLTDFPALISFEDDSNLSAHAQSSGNDLVFTDYFGTLLSHEIEYYNDSNGELVAWVKVPVLRCCICIMEMLPVVVRRILRMCGLMILLVCGIRMIILHLPLVIVQVIIMMV